MGKKTVSLISYDDKVHREQFFELNVEYFEYLRDAALKNLGATGFVKNPREYVKRVFPEFASIKPFEGIIYLLMVDDEAVGMGALRKLEDGVGEIKRMFIRPEFQGKGYGKEMMVRLMDRAKELGYSTLRLDTAYFLEAAVHIYKSAGFKERGKYPGTESEAGPHYIYMEKKL
jgi:GNAT superfamily N-acetyltransferase